MIIHARQFVDEYPCSRWEEQGSGWHLGAQLQVTIPGVSSAVASTVVAVARVASRVVRAMLGKGDATGNRGSGHDGDKAGDEYLLHVCSCACTVGSVTVGIYAASARFFHRQ